MAVPACPADPGARDRRVPPLRGARGHAPAGRGDRGGTPDVATTPVPCRARSRPPRPRRREGGPPRDGEPPLPLGLHPDPGWGGLWQGDRIHGLRARGRGRHLDRRAGELRRPDPHGPVLRRRVHRGRRPPERVRERVPRDRPADGFRLARRPARARRNPDPVAGHPGEPSGEGRRHHDLPVVVRVGARDHGDRRRSGAVRRRRAVLAGGGARRRARARDAVAGRREAPDPASAGRDRPRAVARQPGVLRTAADRPARRDARLASIR